MKANLLLSAVLGTALLTGTASAQTNVLMLVQDAHGAETNVRNFGDWVATEKGYSVTFSADYATNVLDSATSLNQAQRDLLESFDLVIMPRYGVGASGDFASTDWNQITTPMVIMNAFAADSAKWGWTNAASGNLDLTQADVSDQTSPFFDGIDVSSGTINMLDGSPTVRTPYMDASLYNGTVLATKENRATVVFWDGTESSFYDGGTEAPAGRRTLFVGPTFNPDDSRWNADGQQFLLNSLEQTVIPEPSTYAFFFGLAALGAGFIIRRKRT